MSTLIGVVLYILAFTGMAAILALLVTIGLAIYCFARAYSGEDES
jgi:hypothetical protein